MELPPDRQHEAVGGGVSSGGTDSDIGAGQEEGGKNDGEVEVEVELAPRQRAKLKLFNWYAGRELSALAKKLYGNEKGMHATPDEVCEDSVLPPSLFLLPVPVPNMHIMLGVRS